jgi:hypothetical protein
MPDVGFGEFEKGSEEVAQSVGIQLAGVGEELVQNCAAEFIFVL